MGRTPGVKVSLRDDVSQVVYGTEAPGLDLRDFLGSADVKISRVDVLKIAILFHKSWTRTSPFDIESREFILIIWQVLPIDVDREVLSVNPKHDDISHRQLVRTLNLGW